VNLFRGIDVMAASRPLLLGWSPRVIAGVVFFLLQGGMSMEEAQAMQEEQKRQLADLKGAQGTAAPAGKTRIPPPAKR
jgi:hypothetical protein